MFVHRFSVACSAPRVCCILRISVTYHQRWHRWSKLGDGTFRPSLLAPPSSRPSRPLPKIIEGYGPGTCSRHCQAVASLGIQQVLSQYRCSYCLQLWHCYL